MRYISVVNPAIIRGSLDTRVYQTERPLQINPDGSAQATLTYKCKIGSPFAFPVQPLQQHPFYSSLLSFDSNLTAENGGICSVSTTYRGVIVTDRQAEELADYEFTGSLSEAPLETHPRYANPPSNPAVSKFEIDAIELAIQNCTGLPPFVSIDGIGGMGPVGAKAIELFEKKRKGVESYYRCGMTLKKMYCKRTPPSDALIAKVGKQFLTVDTESTLSSTVRPPSGQNYLLMGVSWVKQAGVIMVTEEYMLSGVGGWDEQIYPKQ